MSLSPLGLVVKEKLAHFCSYQERNKKEVARKLATHKGLTAIEGEQIIAELIQENFLDEQRYLAAFIHDKFYINKWGKRRICYSLIGKGIDNKQIQHALDQIPIQDYKNTLQELASKKKATLVNHPDAIIHEKLVSYLLYKGYELSIIEEIVP